MIRVPKSRPKITFEEVIDKYVRKHDIDFKKYPVLIGGIRGYYEDSMGEIDKNDRGIYDDAIYTIIYDKEQDTYKFATFNGNTDPSVSRTGIANLIPDLYFSYTLDLHKGDYMAVCQRLGNVSVMRDGRSTPHTGAEFGINIHEGGLFNTNSEGCQTIYRPQYKEFISSICKVFGVFLKTDLTANVKWKKNPKIVIPYLLSDNID